MWDVVCFLFNFSIFVHKHGIQWPLSRKHTLGTLNFRRLMPRPTPQMPLSTSEVVRVEVSRAAYEEEFASVAPVREKVKEAPALTGAVGAHASPHADGGCADEVKPRPHDVLGLATLTPGSSKGPSFRSSQEAILDDVTSVPRSTMWT
jgi:hypothetical protein